MEIDVKHIARLAMLKLSKEQAETMEQELAAFIAMAERLPGLESAGEPESPGVSWEPEERMDLREDVVVPSYPREAMLQNAPRTAAGCIALPKTSETTEGSGGTSE